MKKRAGKIKEVSGTGKSKGFSEDDLSRIKFLFAALLVLSVGFYMLKDFSGISVGKAYSVMFKGQEFAESVEIELLANVPEIIELTVDNVVKTAQLEFTGSESELTIDIGGTAVSSARRLSDEGVNVNVFDITSEINNYCLEYPCIIPVFVTSKADGAVTLSSVDIKTEELGEKIPPLEEVGHLEAVIEGDAWKVGTSTKKLEFSEDLISGSNRETIRNITTFIDNSELDALSSGWVSNAKGNAPYNQYLYLLGPGTGINSGYIVYTQDTESVTADFLYFKSGSEIGRYLLEFTTALESDIYDSTGTQTSTGLYLTDFKDAEITIFGKTYTIVQARRISTAGNNINLTLMAGAVKDTLNEGATKTYTINGIDYEVTLSFVDKDSAKFTVNGEQTMDLHEGESDQADGIIILVSKILYQDYAGGVHSATFYLGKDKTELEDENIKDVDSTSKLKVNDKIIDNAYVILEGRDNNVTFKLDRIQINMMADDNFYVPANGRLSEIIKQEGGEPEVLFTNRWDIEYRGLKEEPIEIIEIATSGPSRYILKFKDGDGNEVSMPLAEAVGDSALEFGEKDKALINVEKKTITKDDYLILTDSSKLRGERKTYVLQYKGADKITADNPLLKFKDLGSGQTIEQIYSDGSPLAILKVGGADYKVFNATSIKSNDFSIQVDLDADGTLKTTAEYVPITTNYGAEINVTNETADRIDFTVKTPDDDKDENAKDIVETLQATDLSGFITASSGMVNLQRTGNLNFRTPDGQINVAYAYTSYGAFITLIQPAAAPSTLKIEYPKNQREALVYYVIKEEPVPVPTPVACETSLDCPVYNKCENGVCVNFCEVFPTKKEEKKSTADKKDAKSANLQSVVSQLNSLGYDVTGQADIPDYRVKRAGNKIIFSTENEIQVFDQQFDSFVIFDKSGNRMAVKKSEDKQIPKSRPSHIVEFKEKPLIAVKAEVEKEFGIKGRKISEAPKNIKEKLEERLNKYEKRLEEAKKDAIAEMLQVNPNIESKIVNNYKKVFNGVSVNISDKEAEQISSLSSVKNVYKNQEVRLLLEESANQISADEVWKLLDKNGLPITGKGITIGIIDTGVDYTHPDLGGCFGQGCKVIGGYDFANEDNDPMDEYGHGTHVAATAAGNGILKGVAPDANIVAYKVFGDNIEDDTQFWNVVIEAIERSVDPNQDGNFDDHLDVISLSIGGPGNPDDPVSKAIDNAVEAGVIAVIAAGNSGPGGRPDCRNEGDGSFNSVCSPGTARNAITVGAADKCDLIAGFSSRGPVLWEGGILLKPDLVAPGVSICAAQFDNYYPQYKCKDNKHIAISGTSMATPHVSGAAALLLQAHPEWAPETVKSALMSASFDLGLDFKDQGAGRINILDANIGKITIVPQSISFEFKGELTHKETVSIKNLGVEQVTVNLQIAELKDENGNPYNFASLNASEITIDGNSAADFELIVNIPADLEGTFTGEIVITNNNKNYAVPFAFERVSMLTLKAVGIDAELFPDFYLHSGLSKLESAINYENFAGNNFTFKVKSGTYTAYAIGQEPDFDYILMDSIEVPIASDVQLGLKLADAKKFNVMAESLDGVPLQLDQWTKGFNTYEDDGLQSVFYQDPAIGNKMVYVSKKPDNGFDTDVLLYYHGVPIR